MRPTYTRQQARRILLCVGVFWGCWAIGALSLTAVPAIGAVAVVIGLIAGAILFPTIAEGYREYSGVSGFKLLYSFSSLRHNRRLNLAATYAPLRPRWWQNVTGASEWPGRWVGLVLGGLLLLDLVLSVVLPAHR